jgi:thiol-disulfide isomerase/thioredoxin
MWKVLRAAMALLLLSVALPAAQKALKADDILKGAKLKAADQNKAIFLIFGASWCEDCHRLDSFLALPDIAAIFDKYFVVAKLTFGEALSGHPDWDNPGSDFLISKYGGLSRSGQVDLPFIAILDPKAKLLANSNKPGKGQAASAGTGFPTDAEDIKWFLGMLQKTAPAMTEDETHKIQDALRTADE